MRSQQPRTGLHSFRSLRRLMRLAIPRWLAVTAGGSLLWFSSGCCWYSPEHKLHHATTISYVPPKHALNPKMPTASVVDGYSYGFHPTQWRQWADEWIDNGVPLNPEGHVESVMPAPSPAQPERIPPAEAPVPPPPPVQTVPPVQTEPQ